MIKNAIFVETGQNKKDMNKRMTLTLLFGLLLSFSCVLSAQTSADVLQKVSVALEEGRQEQAVSLFRQAVTTHTDKAEMFYWTDVDKTAAVATAFANELASYYKRVRNYDKAYLFYKELLHTSPDDVGYLVSCAETEMGRGREADALKTYEKVLTLDPDNLAANIFIGNYLYLKAEQEKQKIENEYKKIAAPTRMQYARYRDRLSQVMVTGYDKAKEYLQRVVSRFPSTEAKKTLDKIRLIEKEVNR